MPDAKRRPGGGVAQDHGEVVAPNCISLVTLATSAGSSAIDVKCAEANEHGSVLPHVVVAAGSSPTKTPPRASPPAAFADSYAVVTTVAWLRFVHGHAIAARLPAVVNVCATVGIARKWISASFRFDQLEAAGQRVVANSEHGENAYYRLHLLDAPVEPWQRGRSDQTRWVTHFASDVDIAGPGHKPPEGKQLPTFEQAVELIDATLAPSAIIASGGGLYPVWRLAEPFEITTNDDRSRIRGIGELIDASLSSHGFHVDSTALDLARVIRPPGTINHKPGRAPRPVTVLRGWCDGAGDYTIDELLAATHAGTRLIPARDQHAESQRRDRPTSTSPAPWEIFASRYTVDDVVNNDPHRRWEPIRPQGGMRAWRYVGSSSAYSLKQSETGAIIVWSSTIAAALGMKPGDAIDLWGLACGLAGLDAKVAAKGGRA